jgi:hypothetical protein
MPAPEKRFSAVLRCGHCGNRAPMEIAAEYDSVEKSGEIESGGRWVRWRSGQTYYLLSCPSCRQVLLASEPYNTAQGLDAEIRFLYPVDDTVPAGLPSEVEKAYEAARSVRTIDANAFGVLLGRVLEMVCHDRNAQGRTLNEQLRDLAGKGEIPEKLVHVANGLRGLRNVGAHAAMGGLTSAEVPILDDLARAILEYVYSAPLLAQKAEERLKRLKVL